MIEQVGGEQPVMMHGNALSVIRKSDGTKNVGINNEVYSLLMAKWWPIHPCDLSNC